MKTPLTSSATMTEASERAAAVEFTAGWFGSPRGSAPRRWEEATRGRSRWARRPGAGERAPGCARDTTNRSSANRRARTVAADGNVIDALSLADGASPGLGTIERNCPQGKLLQKLDA